MKIISNCGLQKVANDHSSEICFDGFMKIYRIRTKEPYFFLINDIILPPNHPLRFRENLTDEIFPPRFVFIININNNHDN